MTTKDELVRQYVLGRKKRMFFVRDVADALDYEVSRAKIRHVLRQMEAAGEVSRSRRGRSTTWWVERAQPAAQDAISAAEPATPVAPEQAKPSFAKLFEAGTIVVCAECHTTNALPTDCEGTFSHVGSATGADYYRLTERRMLPCGHNALHWLGVKKEQ